MIDRELHAILDLLALELLERCKAANIKWLQAMWRTGWHVEGYDEVISAEMFKVRSRMASMVI